MDRLIAFGDSWTSGRNIIKDDDSDSLDLAWPAHLGRELAVEVINLGKGGSSNKRIWKTAIDFNDYRSNDVVIFLWSYTERSSVFTPQKILDIKPSDLKSKSSRYYRYFFNEYDNQIDFGLRLDHINYFLTKKVKKVLNFSIIDKEAYFCSVEILQTIEDVRSYGSNDNAHPNLKGHKEIARRMLTYI